MTCHRPTYQSAPMYPHLVSAIGATDAFAKVFDTHAAVTETPCLGRGHEIAGINGMGLGQGAQGGGQRDILQILKKKTFAPTYRYR